MSTTFAKARRAAVPLIAIETPDPAATRIQCVKSLNGKAETSPILLWDIMNGLQGINAPGKEYCDEIDEPTRLSLNNPAESLRYIAGKVPAKGIVFFSNAHLTMSAGAESRLDICQAIWNLRDVFKGSGTNLVLLGPSFRMPPELARDIVTLEEPLPDREALSALTLSICKDAGIQAPAETLPTVIDTLLGLSAFEAEQVLALSVTKTGLDQETLWERKVRTIEQTPGLEVWRGGETFNDLGGLSNLKGFLNRVLTSSKTPIRAILYLDEVEKSLAGASGDTSGTSQDQLGVLLKVMQDQNVPGIILVGPPGTGKSSIAKAAGNVANAPVIACDLGAMKGSLVGQSEERIRQAMRVFQAVSQGKGLAIATCNKLVALPPELKRRFSLGTFYIDLPDDEERNAIWPLWLKRHGIEKQPLPPCPNWTGAEVRACCDVAARTGLTLLESAKFIVPVAKSAADAIRQLRELANGKFISAAYPGNYTLNREPETKAVSRSISAD